MKSLFFMPVFNQISELPRLLDEIASVDLPCDELLLINNGSSDGSEDLIRKSGFLHLSFERNRGIGYSIIKATDWALDRKFDILGSIAGNGKMLPSQMHRLIDPIIEDKCDYVTGSRFLPGGSSPNLPLFRRATIPMVNAFVEHLSGVRLTDATCGYRAFRLRIMERARFDWRAEWLYSYGAEYYLYAKVLYDGNIRWMEVPITMRYPAEGRYSKIRPGRDWYAMLKPWVVAKIDGRGFA